MLSMQPFGHRKRPAALPIAEVTISHILVPARELQVRCISSDLGMPGALLIEPKIHIYSQNEGFQLVPITYFTIHP